jgi:feruloyl esterase
VKSCLRLSRLVVPVCFAVVGSAQTPCVGLKSLSFQDAAITSAVAVPEGPNRLANSASQQPAVMLPAHCRVAALLTPSTDSHIEMELWLPLSDWNGKFEAVGNGGWAGSINFGGMASALREAYATASTDTGHKSAETPGGSFALGHPEKLVDYGYRAIHEMTMKSKAIITAFYGRDPRLSYWNGCSNGGRQGLMEAQRYPADFAGIVAGAPAANWTGRALQSLWVAQAAHKEEASYIPPAKYSLLHSAVLQACDALDGVKDGILEDPVRCKFDPGVLRCQDADGPSCLTAAQVEAARKIYTPAAFPVTNHEFYPGLEPGSEMGWATYAGPRPFAIGEDHFKFVVFRNPSWDYRTLNPDTDVPLAERVDNGTINALNPDLRAFFAQGGKLLQYHGWSDPQIPPLHSVKYYTSVVNSMGGPGQVQESYRLFMVPGMQHCGGGPGPDQFNAMGALERWREQGVAPDQIVASHVTGNRVDMTRPLCPYPQVARYKGVGSTNDAANFMCKAP